MPNSQEPAEDISVVILAGGKSSRMGTSKAFLGINGKRFIDITLDRLKPLFKEIIIVTNDKSSFDEVGGVSIVEDLIKEQGPLAGIYTALREISQDSALCVACDMPFLDEGLIRRLLKLARENSGCVIVPKSERGLEPLHAIYPRECHLAAKESLDSNKLSLRDFLNKCSCKFVNVNEEEAHSFLNINSISNIN